MRVLCFYKRLVHGLKRARSKGLNMGADSVGPSQDRPSNSYRPIMRRIRRQTARSTNQSAAKMQCGNKVEHASGR